MKVLCAVLCVNGFCLMKVDKVQLRNVSLICTCLMLNEMPVSSYSFVSFAYQVCRLCAVSMQDILFGVGLECSLQ